MSKQKGLANENERYENRKERMKTKRRKDGKEEMEETRE